MNNDDSVEAEQIREGLSREAGIPTVFFGKTEDQKQREQATCSDPECLCHDDFSDLVEVSRGTTFETSWPEDSGVVTFEEVFQSIFDEAFDLLVERQKKYGPENVRKLGLYGIFTRIEDKMERLRHAFNGTMVRGQFNVTENDESSDESLDDADIDAANYHLIRIALRRGQWGKPLQRDVDGINE